MKKASDTSTYQAMKKDLLEGTLKTAYVFYGEETYLREYYLGQIVRTLVPEGFEEFNYHKVEGKGLTVEALSELCEAMPMMAQRTVIRVDDFDLFKLGEEQRTALATMLEELPDYCCLIFVYDQLEYKPNKVMKKLCKAMDTYVIPVKFEVQDRSDLLNWIGRRFRAHQKKIDAQTAEHLIFTCGSLMNGLIPEIEKVAAYARQTIITKADIDAVASPILEARVFDMTAAISARDFDKAAEMMGTLLQMQEEPIMLLALIGKELRKIYTARLVLDYGKDRSYLMEHWGLRSDYPARLLMEAARKVTTAWAEQAVVRCQELDLRMKSVNGVDNEAELISFLMELAWEKPA